MPRYVAFLRAVNVGGRFVKMAELARHFEALGHGDVQTFIASGNVIFRSRARSATALAQALADGLEPLLGFRSEAFVRSDAELQALAQRAAAQQAAHRAAVGPQGEVNVALLTQPLSPAQAVALAGLRTELDNFVHSGSEVYWLCKSKQSDSKFSNALFERKLAAKTTIRRASMLERLANQLRGGSGSV
jgi:uncharacterized protein (DUF1697 family)